MLLQNPAHIPNTQRKKACESLHQYGVGVGVDHNSYGVFSKILLFIFRYISFSLANENFICDFFFWSDKFGTSLNSRHRRYEYIHPGIIPHLYDISLCEQSHRYHVHFVCVALCHLAFKDPCVCFMERLSSKLTA